MRKKGKETLGGMTRRAAIGVMVGGVKLTFEALKRAVRSPLAWNSTIAYLIWKASESPQEHRERGPAEPSEAFFDSVEERIRRYRDRPTSIRDTRSPLEVSLLFGRQPVVTKDDQEQPLRPEFARIETERIQSRIDYIGAYGLENAQLPDSIRAALGPLIVGIAAQESRFGNRALSDVGAQRIFQFMPETRNRIYRRIESQLGYSDPEMKYLVTQVHAVGEYFTLAYDAISRRARGSLENIRNNFFDSDQAFDAQFMVPVLVDSYHAGEGTMIEVIHWFAEHYRSDAALRALAGRTHPEGYGYDVFHYMTEAAARHGRRGGEGALRNYGRVSRRYVDGVFAYSALLAQSETSAIREIQR